VVNEADTWNATANAVRFVSGEYSSEWSYKDDTMNPTVASPQLSYDLQLTGAEQVIYAKDKLGITGFIQEGAQEDRRPDQLHRKGRRPARDRRDGAGWVDR
jgi:hypothetical protein